MQIFILERAEDGEIYAYVEDAEHHAIVNHNIHSGRSLDTRVAINTDDECIVSKLLAPGEWTSFILHDWTLPRMIVTSC